MAVIIKRGQSKTVALFVTEGKMSAKFLFTQDIIYVMRITESMGLKVQKPMKFNVDNKGTVDLESN